MIHLKSFKEYLKNLLHKQKEIPIIFGSIHQRHDPHKVPKEPKKSVVKEAYSSDYDFERDKLDTKNFIQQHDFYEHGIDHDKVKAGEKIPSILHPMHHLGHATLHRELEQLHGHMPIDANAKLGLGAGDQRRLELKRKRVRPYTTDSSDLNRALIDMHGEKRDPNEKANHAWAAQQWANRFAWKISKSHMNEHISHTHNLLTSMDKEMKRAPALHKDIHVFTGIGPNFNIKKLREEGNERVHLPAFTSTSINPHIARGFSWDSNKKEHKEIIRIKLPAGSKHGSYIGSTGLEGEQEYVLNRGKTLKFNGAPRWVGIRSKSYSNDQEDYLVHDAEIVDD
jgi:hypothetical protein